MKWPHALWRIGRSTVCGGVALAVVALFPSGVALAGLIIPVRDSNGNQVGYIDVDESPDGNGVQGWFQSTTGNPPSVAAAAAACGEDHFNWFQVVLSDNKPPWDADGDPCSPPYIDPPLGGYENQWGDNQPWYWDEGPIPPDPKVPVVPGMRLGDHYDDSDGNGTMDQLRFEDFPGGVPGTEVSFATWLVSLNADGSVHSFHGGFSWDWDEATGGGGGGGRGLWPGSGIADLDLTHPAIELSPGLGWQFYNQFFAVPEPGGFVLAGLALAWFVLWRVVGRR